MKRILYFLIGISVLAAAVSGQDFSLFDTAMGQVGLTRHDLKFDQTERATWGGDPYRLSYFTMFHEDLFKLPRYGAITLAACSTYAANPTQLVMSAARKIDQPIRRGLVGDPFEKYLHPADTSFKGSFTKSRNILADAKYDKLTAKLDLIWALADDADFAYNIAMKDLNDEKLRTRLFTYFIKDTLQLRPELVEKLVEKVDFGRMVAGVEDFAEAFRRTADSLDASSFPDFKLEIKTRKGMVVIGTAKDDMYDYIVPPLLIVDPGGNDTYKYSGQNPNYPLTAIVDLAGNDKYISEDSNKVGLGGAVLGMSIVIDKSGDDLYQSSSVAQGAAIFGAGILMDYSGKDTYRGKYYVQGAATFGIGILADSAGNDSYYCWQNSQGFGFTRGCGTLVDFSGDDRYVAEDSIKFSPSPQTKDHNSSCAQGIGFGKRADYSDGHSWAGGVGVLCDVQGNDSYSAGLFAQGCAYWYSVGMLIDGGGNDTYNGIWYVQGSGAHFGVGYLDDFGGDDTYNATMNMADGAGHDFTIGFLDDRGGNDHYTVPNLSLGGGNANGIGVFWDWSGDDVYDSHGGTTLGRANASPGGAREYLGCWGLFIDGAGNDSYKEPYTGNGKKWIGPKSDDKHPNGLEIGVGVDK
ncbi:MAG: hypothetical protein WAU88_10620 [Candidatus Zixiibacteriota bacterium]